MPKRNPKPNNADTELDKLLTGRDSAGRFVAKTKQIEKLREFVRKLNVQQDKLRKKMQAALKVENQLLKSKSRLQTQVARLTQNLNKQRRSIDRSTRSNRLFAGSFSRLAAGVSLAAIAFKAFRQVQDIANARRNLAVSGGLGSLRNVKQFIGKDVAVVSGAQLIDQFLQQGTSQLALGRQPVITKGLLKLQEQLAGVGTDLANRIILDLSSSFRDPKRLQGFLGALGRGEDVEKTLRGFQTQENVSATLRALNALQVSQVPTTDDPILDAQRELSKATEKLKAEFENLSGTLASSLTPILKELVPELKKLLTFLGGLSTKNVLIGAGIGATAIAVAPTLLRGGLNLAGKGLAAGGSLLPKLIPAGVGLSKAGLAGAAALAAPVAIGGGIAINASRKTEQSLSDALSASERQSLTLRGLDVLALKLERQGKGLRAKRVRIERQIAAIDPAQTERSFLFGDQLTGEFTPAQNRQLETLRKQRTIIQSDIDSLQTRAEVETKVVESRRKEAKSIEDAAKSVDKFSAKLKQTPESKVDRDLGLLFKREDLELDALEQQSETALRRAELEIQKIGPFGILQAGPEAQQLLSQLQSQEDVLRKILGTLDTSTREGRIQANQIKLQEKNLQREGRELQRSLVTAFLDQSLQQAAGSSGRFSKILITSDKNLGIGLRKGVFGLSDKLQKQLVGNVNPNVTPAQPRTASEILGGRSPFANARRKMLVGSSSGDSLINIGNELKKVGVQLKGEQVQVQNQFAEPISERAFNRLNAIQPTTP